MSQVTNPHLILYIRWLEKNLDKHLWNVTGVDALGEWYASHYLGNIRLGHDGRFWLMNKTEDYEGDALNQHLIEGFKKEAPWLYWGEEE